MTVDSRRLVSHFKHSEQAYRNLVACHKSCALPTHKLVQDVERHECKVVD